MSEVPKSSDALKNITEAAAKLKVPAYVLRFWEVKFPQVSPLKLGGKRRYYSPEDIELLNAIKILLYKEGYTIKGVQKILEEKGCKEMIKLSLSKPQASEVQTSDYISTLESVLADIEMIEENLIKVL